MKVWTYAEIKNKVLMDLDMEDEDFVQSDELVGYANEAIDDAEAQIHKIHEDYFLTSDSPTLVVGTSSYAMPTDIYANKIRKVVYQSGTTIYPVDRIRGTRTFEQIAEIAAYGLADEYMYYIKNASASAGVTFVLVPTSRDVGANIITRWYLRNATRVPLIGEVVGGVTTTLAIQLASKIDIPEFAPFVIQWMKCRCYEKEADPRYDSAVAVLQSLRQNMVETLTQMVPDNDDTIEMDLSHYSDHS